MYICNSDRLFSLMSCPEVVYSTHSCVLPIISRNGSITNVKGENMMYLVVFANRESAIKRVKNIHPNSSYLSFYVKHTHSIDILPPFIPVDFWNFIIPKIGGKESPTVLQVGPLGMPSLAISCILNGFPWFSLDNTDKSVSTTCSTVVNMVCMFFVDCLFLILFSLCRSGASCSPTSRRRCLRF